jgi:transglutaminase superfamily protein
VCYPRVLSMGTSRWKALAGLSAAERLLLIRSALLLALCDVALRLLGSSRTFALVRRWSRPAHGAAVRDVDRLVRARRIAWLVSGVSRRVPGSRCLTRSLTLLVLLRREAIPASLRIGVRPGGSAGIEAHAWVECEGESLAERAVEPAYTAFDGESLARHVVGPA